MNTTQINLKEISIKFLIEFVNQVITEDHPFLRGLLLHCCNQSTQTSANHSFILSRLKEQQQLLLLQYLYLSQTAVLSFPSSGIQQQTMKLTTHFHTDRKCYNY